MLGVRFRSSTPSVLISETSDFYLRVSIHLFVMRRWVGFQPTPHYSKCLNFRDFRLLSSRFYSSFCNEALVENRPSPLGGQPDTRVRSPSPAPLISRHLRKRPPASSSAAGLSIMKNEVPFSCDSESFARPRNLPIPTPTRFHCLIVAR